MTSEFISSVSGGVEITQSPDSAKTPPSRTSAANHPGKELSSSGNAVPHDSKKTGAGNLPAIEAAVSRLSDYIQNHQRELRFSVDKATGRTIIRVVDTEKNEVIRQIPPEHVLKLVQRLDSLDGLILEEQA